MATILHQVQTGSRHLDGMSYVLQCDDGSFVVIDGGMDYDAEPLYSYLQTVTGQAVPRITAWILTHNHADHTYAFIHIAQNHSQEIVVESVIYDFPGEDFFQIIQPVTIPELKMVEAAIDTFGARRVVPASGTVFTFGSLKLHVLFTWRDLPPLGTQPQNPTTNDTSLVFRLEEAGQTILFLADVQEAGNRVMMERYGKALKSDVVQVAHHGERSTIEEFYRLTDPKILLWPAKRQWAQALAICKMNRYLLTQSNVEQIFLAGDGTLALPLPLTVTDNPNVPFRSFTRDKNEPVVPIALSDKELDVKNCPQDFFAAADLLPLGALTNNYPDQTATFQLLYRPDALYMQVTLFNSVFAQDPNCLTTHLCDNARVYFIPTVYDDLFAQWQDAKPQGGINDLKLYPFEKNLPDGRSYTSRPDICQSHAYPVEGGYRLVARMPFAKPIKKGEPFSLGLEISLMDPTTGRRSTYLCYPADTARGRQIFEKPGVLGLFCLQ